MKENKQQRNKSPKKRKQEKLTFKELEELMGTKQQTYKRNRHGAITNK